MDVTSRISVYLCGTATHSIVVHRTLQLRFSSLLLQTIFLLDLLPTPLATSIHSRISSGTSIHSASMDFRSTDPPAHTSLAVFARLGDTYSISEVFNTSFPGMKCTYLSYGDVIWVRAGSW